MERGDGGGHRPRQRMAHWSHGERPIFSPICVEERLPLPPFPHIYLGGRGRGAGPGRGGGGEALPLPQWRSSAPSRLPVLGQGVHPHPGPFPVFPPVPSYWSVRRRSSGCNVQCPAVPGSGPASRHKISFYFPVSRRLSFPGFIPVRNPGVNCVLHQLEGLCTVDAVCTVFLVEDLSPEMCGLLLLFPRKG